MTPAAYAGTLDGPNDGLFEHRGCLGDEPGSNHPAEWYSRDTRDGSPRGH